eukprot:Pgem_evm2s17732
MRFLNIGLRAGTNVQQFVRPTIPRNNFYTFKSTFLCNQSKNPKQSFIINSNKFILQNFLRNNNRSLSTTVTKNFFLNSKFRILASFGTILTVGGCGIALYLYNRNLKVKLLFSGRQETSLPTNPPPPPSEDFDHPFAFKPWWWKILFTIQRAASLVVTFFPFAMLSCVIIIRPDNKELRETWLNYLVSSCEAGGCCVQKFAQWLSMRPDLFSEDFVQALSKLRSDAPSHTLEHTKEAIREAFGKEIEEIFIEFNPVPVASGSIAQVYKAKLRPEYVVAGHKNDVAVKVRHPSVLAETFVDTSILFNLLNYVGSTIIGIQIPFEKESFTKALQMQLDLNWEAYNLQRFAHNFADEISVQFPSVIPTFTSSAVLIESWVHGSMVESVFSDVGLGFKETVFNTFSGEVKVLKENLATVLFDLSMKMYLRDNYVHGDLHGGNIIAVDYFHDDEGNEVSADRVINAKKKIQKLGIIDAGLTTALHKDIEVPFGFFLLALCTGDTNEVVEKLVEFSDNKSTLTPEVIENFRNDTKSTLAVYMGEKGFTETNSCGPVNIGEMLGNVLRNMQKNGLSLRGDVALTICTMSLTESAIRQLDPQFDVVKNALPYFVRFRNWRIPSLTSDLKV